MKELRSFEAQHLQLESWVPTREDAFEKQIAGEWHVVTLQEATDHVDHHILQERFHVTHHVGCAILFNKDTFHPNINDKLIDLHDTRRGLQDQIIEGEQGWVLQKDLSLALFRRAAVSGQKFFHVFSLHINNIYAKKKGIFKKRIKTLRAIMISKEVDLVAMVLREDVVAEPTSVLLTKHLWTASCLRHLAPDRCGNSDPFRTTGRLRISKQPGSHRFWKVHGAFSIPRKTLGLRPNDRSFYQE